MFPMSYPPCHFTKEWETYTIPKEAILVALMEHFPIHF